MSAVLDLWHSVLAIFTSGDYVSLAIMIVIALAIGFMMQELSSIITATVGALVLFGVATFVRAVVSVKNANASALAQSDWHDFLGLTMHSLIAYAITFAIVIGVVHLVRSMVAR